MSSVKNFYNNLEGSIIIPSLTILMGYIKKNSTAILKVLGMLEFVF
jgi:hypothetical protein